MVTHSAMTPESSGRGLSHSTFFTYMYFLCDDGCAAKMPLAITQPPLQVELSSWQMSKATVAAAAVGRHYKEYKGFDLISGRVCRKRICH